MTLKLCVVVANMSSIQINRNAPNVVSSKKLIEESEEEVTITGKDGILLTPKKCVERVWVDYYCWKLRYGYIFSGTYLMTKEECRAYNIPIQNILKPVSNQADATHNAASELGVQLEDCLSTKDSITLDALNSTLFVGFGQVRMC